jgi:cell division protein FtsL
VSQIAQVETEMQRRLILAVRDFNTKASEQTATLIRLAEETSDQSEKMIQLTWVIAVLTVAIAVLTFVLVRKG